jgi:hypothetical protein
VFACEADKLFDQENRIFASIHNYTSSAQFITAFKKNDLQIAKKIATEAPWAVNGVEKDG